MKFAESYNKFEQILHGFDEYYAILQSYKLSTSLIESQQNILESFSVLTKP